MKLEKHGIIVIGMIIACLSSVNLWISKAEGQEKRFPSKPIELINNTPPGGPLDNGARIITGELTKELGVAISLSYKTGAGGLTGASYITTAKPDGYTLLTASSNVFTLAPLLEKEVPYDPSKDFTFIAYYGVSPTVLVSESSSSLVSFDALAKFAKAKPGTLNCGSTGLNTMGHLLIEFLRTRGIEMVHVPFKGAPPTISNLLGKHVDLAALMYSAALPHVKSGELRFLASSHKIPEPGVPTLKEKGFSEGEALGPGIGFLAPPNLPKPILGQLAASFEKVIRMPSVVASLDKIGIIVDYKGPDEFKKMIIDDYGTMGKIIKAAGLNK